MKHKNLRLGYDITMDKGATWKPLSVQFWTQEKKFDTHTPAEPFKYMADAISGLALIKLNHFIKSPLATPALDYNFTVEAWKALDPHSALYDRSQKRIRALQSQLAVVNPEICREFEDKFNEQFEAAMKPWGIDMTLLCPLLDTLSWLENKCGGPLLYNFGLNFSKSFMEKLHTLYSFLYNVRSLIAVDFNAHVEDHTHEGVQVDAITDYLPRSEYVVNDALLYWNFKKISASITTPKNFSEPMQKAFKKYSHHACRLVESLPPMFMESMNSVELEEAFYLVQMDWLLGSPAGVLFKIREELFGLQSGYEKIFWKDAEAPHHSRPMTLNICCKISEKSIFGMEKSA